MKAKLILAATLAFILAACETPPIEDHVHGDGMGHDHHHPDGEMMDDGYIDPGIVEETPYVPDGGAIGAVSDRVFFGLDSAILTGEAQSILRGQAEYLKANPHLSVIIEGHCDERGTREYNLALGERRAESAKNYLVQLGITPSRMSTISYGKERPAVLGSGESVWGQNRRAVTVLSQ